MTRRPSNPAKRRRTLPDWFADDQFDHHIRLMVRQQEDPLASAVDKLHAVADACEWLEVHPDACGDALLDTVAEELRAGAARLRASQGSRADREWAALTCTVLAVVRPALARAHGVSVEDLLGDDGVFANAWAGKDRYGSVVEP